MDTLRMFLNRDPACRIEIELYTEDSWSSEGSGPATRPRSKGKRRTPERSRRPAERHPQDSDPFVACRDRDGRDSRHRQEPTGCKVGVPGPVNRGGNNTPSEPGLNRSSITLPQQGRQPRPSRATIWTTMGEDGH